MSELQLVVVIVVLALAFDFLNGFNDAANSIATIVATRVLTPLQAVAWAAFFNFVSAFAFGTEVAKTIGGGMVNQDYVTQTVVLCGLVGAISWTWLASHLGLPISASHALIGGYGGAAMAHASLREGVGGAFHALIGSGWSSMIAFIVIAPLLGMLGGGLLMVGTTWAFRRKTPHQMNRYFRHLQLLSSALFSFAHGSNDAQKTMGIIVSSLLAAGYVETLQVPLWVILAAHASIAMGTLFGGWKVIRTMGHRLTKLNPMGGFCAETGGAATVLFAAHLGVPASTTHTIAGAIAGVGTVRSLRAVRWHKAREIVWAWVLTLPTTIAVGAMTYLVVRGLLAVLP
ncbi:MAG: inorganic phosphate transporter [Bryobacterales bacterium]|nr:inorganic phosphate transporter [Bryobacterales bacterium]